MAAPSPRPTTLPAVGRSSTAAVGRRQTVRARTSARAAVRRRVDEAALAEALRELRTHRRSARPRLAMRNPIRNEGDAFYLLLGGPD